MQAFKWVLTHEHARTQTSALRVAHPSRAYRHDTEGVGFTRLLCAYCTACCRGVAVGLGRGHKAHLASVTNAVVGCISITDSSTDSSTDNNGGGQTATRCRIRALFACMAFGGAAREAACSVDETPAYLATQKFGSPRLLPCPTLRSSHATPARGRMHA
eukprot:357162-Chlamydomonas_euryale.AAC.6